MALCPASQIFPTRTMSSSIVPKMYYKQGTKLWNTLPQHLKEFLLSLQFNI